MEVEFRPENIDALAAAASTGDEGAGGSLDLSSILGPLEGEGLPNLAGSAPPQQATEGQGLLDLSGLGNLPPAAEKGKGTKSPTVPTDADVDRALDELAGQGVPQLELGPTIGLVEKPPNGNGATTTPGAASGTVSSPSPNIETVPKGIEQRLAALEGKLEVVRERAIYSAQALKVLTETQLPQLEKRVGEQVNGVGDRIGGITEVLIRVLKVVEGIATGQPAPAAEAPTQPASAPATKQKVPLEAGLQWALLRLPAGMPVDAKAFAGMAYKQLGKQIAANPNLELDFKEKQLLDALKKTAAPNSDGEVERGLYMASLDVPVLEQYKANLAKLG